MDVTTQERNVALGFRARRSCLPKRKRGHDGFLAFEFENSSRLGQLLIRLCIPPRSQGRRRCQSPVEYIRGDYSLLDPPALACTTEQGGDVSER